MVAGASARMGSFWELTLPLFFFCWEAAASAGSSTSRPGSAVAGNHAEAPAATRRLGTGSEGAFQITSLTEASVPSHITLETQALSTHTSARTLIPTSTISQVETRGTKTIFPAAEIRTLTKIIPSKFVAVITTPTETSATSGSPTGSGTTAKSATGSDLAFNILCIDDSSEEANRITIDVLALARISAEAGVLALGSSTSDGSVPATSTPLALVPDVTALAHAWAAYSLTDIEVTNCSILEIETTTTTPGTSDIDHSPPGGKVLSIPETSTLPDSTDAKSHLTEPTASAETLSAAGTTESATPDTTVETPGPTKSTTEGETAAAKATAPSGALVTVSMNPLGETSALPAEVSHTVLSGAVTVSTEAQATGDETASPALPSAMVCNLSEVATAENSPLEASTTGSTSPGPIPFSRSPLPSVHLTIANGSRETNIALAKTTASAKILKTASTARGKPPPAMPPTARTRWATEVTAGRDGGFLLLRLSVASSEDLTDPEEAESLMQQNPESPTVTFLYAGSPKPRHWEECR
nr:mucin-20 isoform X1 [Manis javanica]XP_036869105.1 mucin-20 isoform X2 [Manis javanica]